MAYTIYADVTYAHMNWSDVVVRVPLRMHVQTCLPTMPAHVQYMPTHATSKHVAIAQAFRTS